MSRLNWNSVCSSPEYLEMSDATNIGFARPTDTRIFLFGKCDKFARMLSDMYGYKIVAYVQLNDTMPEEGGYDVTLVHAFCTLPGGQGSYADWAIDARGVMSDIRFDELLEPFEDMMEYVNAEGKTCRAIPLQFNDSAEFSEWAGSDNGYLEDESLRELVADPMFEIVYGV